MKFDWLDLIEGPFRRFAALSNKEQWKLIIVLWIITMLLMVLNGLF